MTKGALAGNMHFAKFIATLPFAQRSALYLVYGEGVSYDEAADVTGMNMLALMKLIARGHLSLSHWLHQRGLAAEGEGPAHVDERRPVADDDPWPLQEEAA